MSGTGGATWFDRASRLLTMRLESELILPAADAAGLARPIGSSACPAKTGAGHRREISAGGVFASKAADSDELRKQALARVRNDIGKHVRDICERYFVPGETQDLAVLFVPSESVYADLAEHFDDLVQKAHRARVIIVSPSLLMMAIQVLQALVRDARVRDQAHLIQKEVQLLVDDVGRLRTRVDEARHAFPPGAGGCRGDHHLDRQDRAARRQDRADRFRSGRRGRATGIAAVGGGGVRRGIDPGGFEREPHALRDERDAQLEIFHVGAQKLHDKRGQRAVDEIRMLEADGADKGRIEPQRPVQQDLIVDGREPRRQPQQAGRAAKIEQALPGFDQPRRLRMLHVEDQHAGIDVPGRGFFGNDSARDQRRIGMLLEAGGEIEFEVDNEGIGVR